jgi:DUF438 domain-containing protein
MVNHFMSEFIDTAEQSTRVQALLEFVKRVHEGADPDSLREEYADAIETVKPYDVLVIEETLLRDGASTTEVKENIEPILSVFRPALESQEWDPPREGHPVDTMLRENQAIRSHLDAIAGLPEEIENASSPPLSALSELQDHLEALEAIDRHFVRKENELFTHLETHWKHDRPLGVMWSIHDDIRSLRATVESMVSDPETNPETLSRLVSRLDSLLQGLLFKEEQIIFPVAMETLSEAEWAQIQRESRDIGYFEVDPTFEFVEDSAAEPEAAETAASTTGSDGLSGLTSGSVAVGLDTGTLELPELQLLLDTIPVDVTYVDEDDRVRYFNNPEDRIFPRSGSIIGRTVQNCHPPESVETVEKILDAFRSGEHDTARFWIQLDNNFVVIEYHALRDSAENYRGTLEVTQEVSDIRELEGEQRLIDWGADE